MPVLSFFVARVSVEGNKKKATLYLRHSYTDTSQDFTASEGSLTAFCFPLGVESVTPKEFLASEEYTFTLTGGDGQRYQGFCRKFLPPKPVVGARAQLPQVLCLMTEQPWATFYFKVLQVLEQLIKLDNGLLGSDLKELPQSSHAASFLEDLGRRLALDPRPSETIRVPLPRPVDLMGASPHRLLATSGSLAEDCLELQVPIDCGNGKWNCGVSLARLLWDVPAPALATLMASMLLERRIILVSSQRDTVTAAVQAAAALLYPFKWHHIYLPMLPEAFKDYLSAPMPFMVGLQSQMLHTLSSIPMDEITVIDLDIRSCKPAPGSQGDDARGLPWREQLEAALTAAHKLIRSPTEHETSPIIASIMQEFFVKLLGNYHRFIHPDVPAINARWAAQLAAGNGGATPQQSPRMHRESSSGRLQTLDSDRSNHGSLATVSQRGQPDNVMRAADYVFEHAAFVRSHKYEKARTFLSHLRGSQLYAMFIQERLEAMAAADVQGAEADLWRDDPFEQRIAKYQEARKQRFDQLRAARVGSALSRQWNAFLAKHRRADSGEVAMISSVDLGVPSGGGGLAASMRRIISSNSAISHSQSQSLMSVEEFDPGSYFTDDGGDDDYQDLMWEQPGSARSDTSERRLMSASNIFSSVPARLDKVSASFAAPAPSHSRLATASTPVGPPPAGLRADSATTNGPSRPVPIAPAAPEQTNGSFTSKFKNAFSDLSSVAQRVSSGTAAATSKIAAAASNLTNGSYRPQLTGDSSSHNGTSQFRSGLAKYTPQNTGGGSSSLLDIANLKLKPPPNSTRPLLQPQQQESTSSSGAEVIQTSSFFTRSPSMAGGTGTGTTSDSQQEALVTVSRQTDARPLSSSNGGAQGPQLGLPGKGGLPGVGVGGVVPADGFDGFSLLAASHSPPHNGVMAPPNAATVSLLDN